MTIRPASVPGLPAGIEVRRSTRRTRSVAAFREDGTTIIVAPARMPSEEIVKHALALHARLMKKAASRQWSDEDLSVRARALIKAYLPEVRDPASIRWSTNQNRRWGSCTTVEGTIRISSRLQGMPQYVVDSVIIHELAHLQQANHGPAFNALIERFPDLERANAFLAGVEFAAGNPQPSDID